MMKRMLIVAMLATGLAACGEKAQTAQPAMKKSDGKAWEGAQNGFVAEGSGYDLHWDVKFDCIDKYEWDWETEPKKSEWTRGDFIYVPPYTIHQHVASAEGEARLIVISNRMVKEMGFDWFDQIEAAPGFEQQTTGS